MSGESLPEDCCDLPEAHLRTDASLDVNNTDTELVASADRAWHGLSSLSREQTDEHNSRSRRMIVSLYKLCMYLNENQEAYRNFVKSRKAYSDRNDDPFYIITIGIMKRGDPKKGKTLRTNYAQACRVIQRKGVDPSDAMDWLAEPIHPPFTNKGLTGISKTKYIWAQEPEGIAACEKKEPHRRKTALVPIQRLLGSDYGAIGKDSVATDLTSLSEGGPMLALVQVVDGMPVVKNLLTSDPILMSPVVKKCLNIRTRYILMKR